MSATSPLQPEPAGLVPGPHPPRPRHADRAPARKPDVSPWRVFALVLVTAFAIESLIMLVLPRVRAWPHDSILETLVDSAALTLGLAPLTWWLVVRPIRNLSRDRGELLGRLMAAQDDERARLARDLHDELGQHLTALRVGLRSLERQAPDDHVRQRAGDLNTLAGTALDEVRRLARGLSPAVLEDFGLSVAVRRLAEDFRTAHGIELALDDGLEPGRRFDKGVETTAYRLVQESLTNVARHAGADAVEVTLRETSDRVELEVRDDGRGLDAPAWSAGARGVGLRGIEERARWQGGALDVQSGPGEGTTIRAWLPLLPRTVGRD